MVLFLSVSLMFVVTSNHKQRKKSCHVYHLQFLAALATAVPLPVAVEVVAEAVVEVAVEAAADGEAMVVEMIAKTEA
jgi:hypothetical protein